MIKGVFPEETQGLNSLARCLMVYDWERNVDGSWIDLIEGVFANFNDEPIEGTGHIEGKDSHGAYKRVRKQLRGFLDGSGQEQNFSIRVRGTTKHQEDGFFPSDISISCGRSKTTELTAASFAVREHLVGGIGDLIEQIGKAVFEVCGPCYGNAWDFPAAFGPDAYISSMGAIPKGHKWGSNREYSARITRWRDNIWHRKLRPNRGYFREIYPINFLVDAHLNMPFRDEPLCKFMEANGTLRLFEFNEKMYRWDVPDENLDEVRKALEPSGLILSSEAEPLQIN